MQKILSLMLAAIMAASVMVSCGAEKTESSEASAESSVSSAVEESSEAESSEAESSEAESSEAAAEGFPIYYPSYMQEAEGESLVLEQKPEKVIVLSNSALQIMLRCDMKPIAVTKPNKLIDYPDWVRELPVITTGMSSLDVESIISMEPDLLIMGAHLKEDFAQQITDAGIPIYYTSEGPTTTYKEAKEEAVTLTRSFGTDEDIKAVEDEFAAVEARAAEFSKTMDPKKMMILFGAPPSYQQTSMGYLGSMLCQLPFENLSDELIGVESRLAPLDLEKLLELDPEIIFAISPTAPTAETIQGVYEEEFGKNPQLWEALQAVKNDNVIYLSSEYVTSKGIHIINSMNTLMDMLEEKLAK